MIEEIKRSQFKDLPCKDCEERFSTCHSHCPKDERGEFGYAEWLNILKMVKANEKEEKDKPFVKYNPFDY